MGCPVEFNHNKIPKRITGCPLISYTSWMIRCVFGPKVKMDKFGEAKNSSDVIPLLISVSNFSVPSV